MNANCTTRSEIDRPLSRLFSGPDLFHGALLRLLFRTPAQKLCPMPKAPAGKMVILELAHQFRLEREPFCIAGIARPTAGTAGSLAGKSFSAHVGFEN